MAVGDVKGFANATRAICLLTAQTANNSPPAADNAGVPCYDPGRLGDGAQGACWPNSPAMSSTLMISSSAGSGTMVGTFTLWGYKTCADAWFPIPVNDTDDDGLSNALAETAANEIRYHERFPDLGHFDRLYLELASVGGTDTAFEAWLVTSMESF